MVLVAGFEHRAMHHHKRCFNVWASNYVYIRIHRWHHGGITGHIVRHAN